MCPILIFSDNETYVNTWLSLLSPHYKIKRVDSLPNETSAQLIIIDAEKIKQTPTIMTTLKMFQARSLIIGDQWTEEQQVNVLVQGAAGYCEHKDTPSILLPAIQQILKGDMWMKRHLISTVISRLVKITSAIPPNTTVKTSLITTLSKRELDVANFIQQGENNKTIALKLSISERTVKAHLSSIFKKLNVSDRLHLALFLNKAI